VFFVVCENFENLYIKKIYIIMNNYSNLRKTLFTTFNSCIDRHNRQQMSEALRISIDNKIYQSDTSIDLTQTTPVIRPWFNGRQQSAEDPVEAEQSNPFEVEDYDEDVYSSSDYDLRGLPATPSRLLTITSMDFGDDRQRFNEDDDDEAILSGNEEKSVSYSQQDANNDELDFDLEGRNDFDEMDRDIRNHDDIITEHMNKLNLAAQAHFSQVIQRLLKEKNNSMRTRDAFFSQQMQKQQDVIDDLNSVLSRTEERYERETARSDRYCIQLATKHTHMKQLFASEYSLSRVLQCWKQLVLEQRQDVRNIRLAERSRKRHLLTVCFSALSRESTERRLEHRQYDSKSHYEDTMKEMVVKYETEVTSLQVELQEAHALIRQERLRRQQLEEDLRRMFLKNMTTMNMEALSLFQDPQTLPAQMAEFGPGVEGKREQWVLRQQQEEQIALRNQMKAQQRILQERQQQQQQQQQQQHDAGASPARSSRPQHPIVDENSSSSGGVRVAADGSKVIRVGSSKTIVTQTYEQHSTRRQEIATSSASSSHSHSHSSHSHRSSGSRRRQEDADPPQPRAPLRNMSAGR
jgi:hypothetical protein